MGWLDVASENFRHGLTIEEWRDLALSVNTGRGARRLRPVGAARRIAKALTFTRIDQLAEDLGFSDSSTLRRIVRLANLPAEVDPLVEWGGRSGAVSMTSASELSRVVSDVELPRCLKMVAENALTKEEVKQVTQVTRRQGLSVDEAIQAVIETRPRVVRNALFIGAYTDPRAVDILRADNGVLVERALVTRFARSYPEIVIKRISLGEDRFSILVSPEDLEHLRHNLGSVSIEDKVTQFILSVASHE